jgi:hypothetical protein
MSTLDNFLYFLPILTAACGIFGIILYAEYQERQLRKVKKGHK